MRLHSPYFLLESAARSTPTRDDYMRLWKSLFYTVWYSDKTLVQQELALRLASLTRELRDGDGSPRALLFLRAFFDTVRREWMGLDRLRLDKFMSLIRRMVAETIRLCADSSWHDDTVKSVASLLAECVMTQRPDGIRFHVTDVFVEELASTAPDVPVAALLVLLQPFAAQLRVTDSKTIVDRVIAEAYGELLARRRRVAHAAAGVPDSTTEQGHAAAAAAAAPAHAPSVSSLAASKSAAKRQRAAAAAAAAATAAAAVVAPLVADAEAREANAARAFRHLDIVPIARELWRLAAGAETQGGHRERLYAVHGDYARAARELAAAAGASLTDEDLCPSVAAVVLAPVARVKRGRPNEPKAARVHAINAATMVDDDEEDEGEEDVDDVVNDDEDEDDEEDVDDVVDDDEDEDEEEEEEDNDDDGEDDKEEDEEEEDDEEEAEQRLKQERMSAQRHRTPYEEHRPSTKHQRSTKYQQRPAETRQQARSAPVQRDGASRRTVDAGSRSKKVRRS